MTRKLIAAVLVATLLSLLGGQVHRAMDTVVPDICKTLSPDDWFWRWWYGCDKDAAGGGGSGAS